MTEIEGDLYTAGTSSRQIARVVVSEDGLVSIKLASGANYAADSMDQLKFSARMGNTPRFIDFNNGDRFESPDNDGIDRLLAGFQQGSFDRLIHLLESHMQFVLIVAVLVVGFVWVSGKYGIPAMADITADALPLEVSQYMGQGTLELLDESVFESSKLPQARQNQLKSLFQPYINQYSEYQIKVDFRHAEDIGANAMALPGGQIIFTDAMVEMAQDDNELVAILGHEIGHVVHRHLLRRVLQSSAMSLVVLMITGDVSAASSLIAVVPTVLLELSYSRDFENEADDFAFDFLQDNQLETHYFADIMMRLMEQDAQDGTEAEGQPGEDENAKPAVLSDFSPYLSTHPATRERVIRFQ